MDKKVLIIEDNPSDASLVKNLLIKEGLGAETAANGAEGLAKAFSWRPDLIVLDLMLPDIDGYEVCRLLRDDVRLAEALIIIMSSKDDLEDVSKAFQLGADDYVIKPVLPALFVRKIKLYLGLK